MSPNISGALMMIASMVAFTVNDTFVKMTGGAVPLFQLIFLRGIVATILVLALARYLGALHFRFSGKDRKLILARAVAELSATFLFLSALFNMPIGNLTAVLQVVPLTVTLGSALLFGEAVGWRRMAAIVIGFGGVMLIIRPGTDAFDVWSIYALLAVFCVTARDLITRRLSPEVPGITVSLVTSVLITCAAGLVSFSQPWATVDSGSGGLIIAAAFFILGGYFFSVQAMRFGETSFVSPFRYTGLIAAMFAGVLFFDEQPDTLTLVGAGIVVATGLFTFYRESIARQS